jgi:hypothetical protein
MGADPEFPICITWHESGEVDSYDDHIDLLCNLEDFDSDRDGWVADVCDASGRAVWLRVSIMDEV